MQGAIYKYQHENANPPMVMMSKEDFNKYEGVPGRHVRNNAVGKERGRTEPFMETCTTSKGRRKATSSTQWKGPRGTSYVALTKSASFMLAMSHVCSLEQKIDYNNDTPPNNVADWDRKTWSTQNYFSTPGVPVDVGNFILGTMFLAIRHALEMESPIDQHRQNEIDTAGSRRLAPWDCEPCIMHPIVSGSATAGMVRKQGYCQAIANMSSRSVPCTGRMPTSSHRDPDP